MLFIAIGSALASPLTDALAACDPTGERVTVQFVDTTGATPMVWVEFHADSSVLDDCRAWRRATRGRKQTRSSGVVASPTGLRAYAGIGYWSRGETPSRSTLDAHRHQVEQQRQRLLVSWDARELTEQEIRSVWRDRAERDPAAKKRVVALGY